MSLFTRLSSAPILVPIIVTVVVFVTAERVFASPRYCNPLVVICTTSIEPLPPPDAAVAVSTSN